MNTNDQHTPEHFSLCQDCLRAVLITEHSVHDQKCICGGDLCSCSSCIKTLHSLFNAERDYKKLELQSPITHWTPENGIYESLADVGRSSDQSAEALGQGSNPTSQEIFFC